IARELEDDATGLVARARKAERTPVHRDLAAADPEEPTEVDDGSAHLPGSIDHDVDDPAHVFAGRAANFLAENSLHLVTLEDNHGWHARRTRRRANVSPIGPYWRRVVLGRRNRSHGSDRHRRRHRSHRMILAHRGSNTACC